MIRRVYAIAKKETKHLLRDVRLLAVVFSFPVFLLIIFGYAINFDVRNIRVAVLDNDNSELSAGFIRLLERSGYFTVAAYLNNEKEASEYLNKKLAQCVVIIPNNLSKEFYANRSARIQTLIDGVDGNAASIIGNYLTAAAMEYSQKTGDVVLKRKAAAINSPIAVEQRFLFNPELNSTKYLLPGLIAMIIIVVSVITVSLSIVREKERGTIEQINASPLTAIELLIGKCAPYGVIALLNMGFVLIAGYLLFDVGVKGSWLLLLISAAIFILTSLCFGVFISTIVDSQQLAFQISAIITLLPSMVLSGFIFPIESMPFVIQIFTNITPAKFFVVILRSILLKGAGLEAFWEQLIYLMVFAAIFLGLSAIRFKKLSYES